MKGFVFAIFLALTPSAISQSLLRHWAVSAQNINGDGARIVFTLIGSGAFPKLPILSLSYGRRGWNSLLTCGEPLHEDTVALLMFWDGNKELASWRMTRDHGAAFSPAPERFIAQLLQCHILEVDLPALSGTHRATFDVTGLQKEIDHFPQAKKDLAPKLRESGRSVSVEWGGPYSRLSSR